jgi:hypothetical protein
MEGRPSALPSAEPPRTAPRPGGNTTGFASFEYGLSAKWLELLKQVAPRVTRVAVLRDSLTPVEIGQLAAIQGVAPSFGVELTPIVVRDPGEIEPAVAAFARSPDDGLIVTIGTLTDAHRDAIGKLAARLRLPAVYPFPFFVRSGGLISYELTSQIRIGASPATSIVFSRARSRLIFRCSSQRKSSWPLISKLPRRSASKSRRRYSPAPTRLSNEKARVHHAARRLGCMAAHSASAAGARFDHIRSHRVPRRRVRVYQPTFLRFSSPACESAPRADRGFAGRRGRRSPRRSSPLLSTGGLGRVRYGSPLKRTAGGVVPYAEQQPRLAGATVEQN